MPLLHNFGWVGSLLLATLLATNWFFSPQIAAAPLTDVPLDQKVHIGIHTDHKWPERVVLDTTRSTAAHDAKGDGQTDVGGNEAAVLAERPFRRSGGTPVRSVCRDGAPERPCFRTVLHPRCRARSRTD
jgi:hypothetical protein